MPRDRHPRPTNRTADDRPRDYSRTARAKRATIDRRKARRDASIRKGRA